MLMWMVTLALAGGCEEQGDKTAAAVTRGLAQMGNNLRANMPPEDMVARVRKLVDDGMVCTHEHRQRAAYVLMRGGPEDLDVAAKLARAVYDDTQQAEMGQMTAQALDLARIKRGKPQNYGVVTATVAGKLCIYSWDPAFTDEQRAELGIPPLKETLKAFEEASGYVGYLELEDLRAAKRLCDLQEAKVDEPEPEEAPEFRPEEDSEDGEPTYRAK